VHFAVSCLAQQQLLQQQQQPQQAMSTRNTHVQLAQTHYLLFRLLLVG
jgi:hypothetical protein